MPHGLRRGLHSDAALRLKSAAELHRNCYKVILTRPRKSPRLSWIFGGTAKPCPSRTDFIHDSPHHCLKIPPTAATIMANPTAWFHLTGCFRYSTENTEKTTSVITS